MVMFLISQVKISCRHPRHPRAGRTLRSVHAGRPHAMQAGPTGGQVKFRDFGQSTTSKQASNNKQQQQTTTSWGRVSGSPGPTTVSPPNLVLPPHCPPTAVPTAPVRTSDRASVPGYQPSHPPASQGQARGPGQVVEVVGSNPGTQKIFGGFGLK